MLGVENIKFGRSVSETEDLPPPLPNPKVSKSVCPNMLVFNSFGTIFGKYILRPWDWGGVGVDPRFLSVGR
eukprot:6449098-Amphidinium_carterae.1